MRKIVIISDVSNLQNPTGGPSICMKLLQNEMIRQIKAGMFGDIEFSITSGYTDVKDSIVWHWSPIYHISLIDLLVENKNIIICGPNSFFKGGQITDYEKYLIENKKYTYLFMHPKQYSTSVYFKEHVESIKIFDIIYPVNPKCYLSSPFIARIYDVLIYKKFGCEDTFKSVEKMLKNYKTNTVTYGEYQIEQLVELSASSKCCIYLSCGETGGTACAEILCNGCPIISYFGNLTYGDDRINCIKLPDNGTFIYKPDIIIEHIETCMKMNNTTIAVEAREKFDLEKIASNTIKTLQMLAIEN